MKMDKNGNSVNGGSVTKKDMEDILAKASAGPVQTIRIEQAPLKISTDAKPQEPYKM